MADRYIVGFARTPFGLLQGGLSAVAAPELGSVAIRAALRRSGVEPGAISEVILGHVITAGVGQAPARQAAIAAGLPSSVPCMAVNKVCGSGMKAVMLACQSQGDLVVAGGMESMSQAPHLLPGVRSGYRLGDRRLVDSLIWDGLWDVYSDRHMGNCVEECIRERGVLRADQDAYAVRSYQRAQQAQEAGFFAREIAPVEVGGQVVETDEGPSKVVWEKIPTLLPSFEEEGTITAANASTINDGAAALVIATEDALERYGVSPLARIVSSAEHSHDPTWFSTAPASAIRTALERAGWGVDDVDLFEINEAFAAVPLLIQREFAIPDEKLNRFGGAIALGHPIGASGARIAFTLISALRETGGRRGVAAICIGGGEATALCVEYVG